jgi:hypothetical protein
MSKNFATGNEEVYFYTRYFTPETLIYYET